MRTELTQTICNNSKVEQHFDHRHYYILKDKHLVWCPVFKAASTNWLYNLIRLSGRSEIELELLKKKHPSQPNEQGRIVAPVLSLKETVNHLNKPLMKKLLITRHPFDRLVSAFRDKLERCINPKCILTKEWYYKKYGKEIVRMYRQKSIQRHGETYYSKRNNYGSPYPVLHRIVELPTFWEFVQWIIHKNVHKFDEHWKPMYLYCSPCTHSYNYILKFESIEEEERILSRMWNTTKIQNNWENRNDNGLKKMDITMSYFKLLDKNDILKLYEIYKYDFLMFDYDAKPFL
ncbi:carbohydrate sulfotransferase 11 isoform X2 [Eurytemora carolleeae]|nr:carbohydrate sulfotransferase 11 isoform X2 [Eurytemora carolleeae]|eukprot:XP_023323409.1 carbohydrate sulfotransferase 11-like isoform X2 [Eurytemora affinis]